MAKKVVTIYIDDTSIRLLVAHGKRIKRWAELPVEPGAIEGAVVIKEAEVAAKVRQLLKGNKIKTKKVIVGLSGLLCLTRPIVLPQLPTAMLPEAVMREAKTVLPLSLDQFYISWHTIPATKMKTQVFLAAVRCRSADALLKMLRQAGLNPYIMDLKPLAVTRLVKDKTAVIIDIQPTEFDIIIMVDGIPHPIRNVPFPTEAHSWQEKLPMIKDDLDRTTEFYNSNNPEKSLTPGVPVYVSGDLTSQPELWVSLSNILGHQILPITSPLKSPKQVDMSHYMVNIGLAIKETSLRSMAGPSVANSNLLPTAYRPKPISWARVVALPSALTILAILVPMVMLAQSTSNNIASVRNQLDTTNRLLGQKHLEKQKLSKDIAELEKELAQAEVSRNTFTGALNSLNKQGKEIEGNLEVIVNNLPDSVTLTSVSHASDILTVSGRASSETEAIYYARNLDGGGRFSEIIIASMRSGQNGTIDFTLLLKTGG